MNSTVIAAFILCSLSWISVSVSGSQIMQVQSGEEVTLQCSMTSEHNSLIFWFRLVNRTKISCISFTISNKNYPYYCDGLKNGKFEMSSSSSTLFLKIRRVDISDSGLYFCGFYTKKHILFNVTHLNIAGRDEPHDDADINCKKESDGTAKLTSVILGALTVFLVMVIIGLVVQNRKLQTAASEEHNPQQHDNLDAALSLYSTTIRNRRPASEREVETRVVYAASK